MYQKNPTVSIAVPASVGIADRIFEGTNQLGDPFTEVSPLVLFKKGYQGTPHDNPVGCSCHLANLPGSGYPEPDDHRQVDHFPDSRDSSGHIPGDLPPDTGDSGH